MPKLSGRNFYFNGFRSPNGTIVPDDVFDVLMPELSEAELRVLLYIVRRTFGWKKEKDSISLSQMVGGVKRRDGSMLDRGTGMSRRGVMMGCAGLLSKGVIVVEKRASEQGDSDVNIYSLRFRDETGVGNQMPYPRERSAPPVGNQVHPQQTVLQKTDINKQQQQKQAQNDVSNDVVVALMDKGITQKVAQGLAGKYPEDLIRRKIELLEFLLDTQSKLVEKNPAGYLRKAIEEDYNPPKNFEGKDAREAKKKRREDLVRMEREQEAQRDQERRKAREQWRTQVVSRYQIGDEQLALWSKVVSEEQENTTQEMLKSWLGRSLLVTHDDGAGVVAVPYQYPVGTLAAYALESLQDRLGQALNQEVELDYEVIHLEDLDGTPEPD